ncbi:MAG: alpha/beta hydrolase fold domain-containing protein, partial [Bacteroidales bacterium]|nr:alpha/beta hydrolase fold domain-containing protein [Bacteroidales bacterium]
VIPSGKLPKYSYIPELNVEIAKMVQRLNSDQVILVDQAKGFDCQTMTIGDMVHPNPVGAEKMAEVWFTAMKKILLPSEQTFTPEIITYKKGDKYDLKLHIFKPRNAKKEDKLPVMIYFFGGGWVNGTPLQYYRECAYYASKGMVAIAADYRISSLHKTTAFESAEDARDAIRWVRQNARQLQIDPSRIAASGSSAGGHLAAVTGIIEEKLAVGQVSSKPNLLLLYYPVVDNSESGYGPKDMKTRYQEISPLHNITSKAPATLFILGTKDALIPVKTGEEFKLKMEQAGVYCELDLIEGAGHPIFLYAKPLTEKFYTIRNISDEFLKKYGYLKK